MKPIVFAAPSFAKAAPSFAKLSLALFLLTPVSVGCARAQRVDLSTDEGVIAELQKMVDARNAARAGDDEKLAAKLRAARRLGRDSVCIERKEPAKIIVVGFFRNDYGCHFEGAFVGTRFYDETEIFGATKTALERLGWQKANQEGRERLALFWIEKVLHAFDEVFYPNRENPPQHGGVQPPRAVTEANGDVIVTLWIQLPTRMPGEKRFRGLEYTFNSDGSLSGARTPAGVGD